VVGQYYFYQNDHLGTPQKLTAINGAVVWSAKYNSFGEATAEVETIENSLRFPGQYYDRETGLHYNWHRYYDPGVGRYISADPIGLVGGINLYIYVFGNPVNWGDPAGLRGLAVEIGGGIGIGDNESSKSKADSGYSGVYIGAKKGRMGYAELGAFTARQRTKIGGGKLGLGINFIIYHTDAEDFFAGTTKVKTITLGPGSYSVYYDECTGEEIGRSINIYGAGGGFSWEEGESEGLIFPLQ